MNTFYLLSDDRQTRSFRHDRRLLGQKAPLKAQRGLGHPSLAPDSGGMRELALFNLAIDSKRL
jgi:hypothetical protein